MMKNHTPTSGAPVAALDQPVPLGRELLAHPFRVFHLVYLLLVIILLGTGVMVHAGSAPGWSFFGDAVPPWLPAGRWAMWHVLGGTLLLGMLLPGLAFYVYQNVHNRRPGNRAFWHWLLWLTLAAMCLTGLLLMNNWGPARLYGHWRYIHLAGAVLLLPIGAAGHVYSAWPLGWRVWLRSLDPFHQPRPVALLAMLVPGLAAGGFLVLGHALSPNPQRVLTVPRLSNAPDDLWSADWDSLPPLHVRLANGVGFTAGITNMYLRAFHDGVNLYVRADWDDAAEQRNLYPWLRTADGWKRLETGIDSFEDKMAIAFPIEPSIRFGRLGCAYACHLGGGRDYGYKSTHVMLDIWHWKSARTQSVGQVDDKYWTVGDPNERGPVGRKGDPFTGGGYEMNATKGEDHPAFLPDPAGGGSPPGVILKSLAVPYSQQRAETIKPGTIVPGLIVAPIEGDRGDVLSEARFENGQWHLIIRRPLSTSSPYDTQFEPGGAYTFAAAAFDHTRWRHAYHHGTYRLVLDP